MDKNGIQHIISIERAIPDVTSVSQRRHSNALTVSFEENKTPEKTDRTSASRETSKMSLTAKRTSTRVQEDFNIETGLNTHLHKESVDKLVIKSLMMHLSQTSTEDVLVLTKEMGSLSPSRKGRNISSEFKSVSCMGIDSYKPMHSTSRTSTERFLSQVMRQCLSNQALHILSHKTATLNTS